MNYIKHLTHWFELLRNNEEVKPPHIAMYIVLFQLWNLSRFADHFIISRQELMNLCKIGSKSTYSNCMSDMHRWGWIAYRPSHSKYGSSTVSLANWSEASIQNGNKRGKNTQAFTPYFETTCETTTETSKATTTGTSTATTSVPTIEPAVGHNNKTYKQQTENNKDLNNLKRNYYEPM